MRRSGWRFSHGWRMGTLGIVLRATSQKWRIDCLPFSLQCFLLQFTSFHKQWYLCICGLVVLGSWTSMKNTSLDLLSHTPALLKCTYLPPSISILWPVIILDDGPAKKLAVAATSSGAYADHQPNVVDRRKTYRASLERSPLNSLVKHLPLGEPLRHTTSMVNLLEHLRLRQVMAKFDLTFALHLFEQARDNKLESRSISVLTRAGGMDGNPHRLPVSASALCQRRSHTRELALTLMLYCASSCAQLCVRPLTPHLLTL